MTFFPRDESHPITSSPGELGRAPRDEIKRQSQLFSIADDEILITDALPVVYLILNSSRQVVYANKRLMEMLLIDPDTCVQGKRVGEILNCAFSSNNTGGCGTAKNCAHCGILQATIAATAGNGQIAHTCRLSLKGGSAADLKVMATPMRREGEDFTILTLQDIESEKRREVLEKTFFHDLMNTVGGVSGLVELLSSTQDQLESQEIMHLLQISSRRLVDEVLMGQQLSNAEGGHLEVNLTPLDVEGVVKEVVGAYRYYIEFKDHQIDLDIGAPLGKVHSDKTILCRIIGNLVKNALEASSNVQPVRVQAKNLFDNLIISVANAQVMPEKVKDQVFMRSFSTKGPGRGVGTYSVKLLTEKYLGGKVWFKSEPDEGTTFFLSLPLGSNSSQDLLGP